MSMFSTVGQLRPLLMKPGPLKHQWPLGQFSIYGLTVHIGRSRDILRHGRRYRDHQSCRLAPAPFRRFEPRATSFIPCASNRSYQPTKLFMTSS